MRILKYLFLLLLLLLIGVSVFVATQQANYDINKSKLIKNPKAIVFNYINDFKNWKTFNNIFLENTSINFTFTKITSGKGATLSWTGAESNGKIQTVYAKENDSLSQKMIQNGDECHTYWKFKDTLGGTLVTLRTKGKLDFKSKIVAFFNGGTTNSIAKNSEKSLNNINKVLNYELNTFSIKINGIVSYPGGFYIKQYNACKEKEVANSIKKIIPKLSTYFKKNNLTLNGKPFIIYNKIDKTKDIIAFSVCFPILDSIHIPNDKNIEFGELKSFTAIKTTLKGDDSHIPKAWKKADEYITENKLVKNNSQQMIEVYLKNKTEIKSPSKWITEIFTPIYPKSVAKPNYRKPKNQSTSPTSGQLDLPKEINYETPTEVPSP